MLKKLMTCVKKFHSTMLISKACDFPTERMERLRSPVNAQLLYAKMQMQTAALLCEDELEKDDCDPRYLRLHLRLEETAEYVEAIMNGNACDALDALCDMNYVGAGDSVQFGWDLSTAQQRVCDSNDTKTPGNGPRLRNKGETFVKPIFEDLI